MSDHDTRSNTSEEESDRRSAKLTGLAIGGGSSPDRLVGMSSPPPYPPHGKEAVGRDSVPTAVSGATCPQSRGSSAAPAATEQNMSSPPDIERPPFTGIGCSTGQGKQTHSQYGAWPSSLLHATFSDKSTGATRDSARYVLSEIWGNAT